MSNDRSVSMFTWVWVVIAIGTYAWAFFLGWSTGVAIATGGLVFSGLAKWALS